MWREEIDVSACDARFLALQCGRAALVALTNQQSAARLVRRVNTTFGVGTVLRNVFWPRVDRIVVGAHGVATISLDWGEAKIYVPT